MSHAVTICLLNNHSSSRQTNQTLPGILFSLPEVVQLHQHVTSDFILMGYWSIELYKMFPLPLKQSVYRSLFLFSCVYI